MELDYSRFILMLAVLFGLFFLFNVWYFRRLQKMEKQRQQELETEHLENIARWKDYAVTCKKFENGECDLSIPCDICTYYKEPKDEQEGQETS